MPRPVRWLHVPKSGSTFINVLARYACPSLASSGVAFVISMEFEQWRLQNNGTACKGLLPPWLGHTPVRAQDRAPQRAHTLVAVFRAPSQRLISGFHHTEGGVANSMIAPGMPPGQRAAMQRAAAGSPARYSRWPGIAGCATKMLLGWQCASQHRLSSADTERAVHALEQFAFIGLLEHWTTSVCVFHALLWNASRPAPAELALAHVGSHRLAASGASRDAARLGRFRYNESVLHGFVDVHDERVYSAAKKRFWADARRTQCEPPRAAGGARSSRSSSGRQLPY